MHPLTPGSVLQHYETELLRLRSEYAGISGAKRMEMEELLMEGDLLEVTMDEIQQLWQLLQTDAEILVVFERGDKQEEKEEDEEEGEEEKKEEQVCVCVCVCAFYI